MTPFAVVTHHVESLLNHIDTAPSFTTTGLSNTIFSRALYKDRQKSDFTCQHYTFMPHHSTKAALFLSIIIYYADIPQNIRSTTSMISIMVIGPAEHEEALDALV